MGEEAVEERVSTKLSNNQTNAKKDIFLGICLFVGMNLVLIFVGHVLRDFFWRLGFNFLGNSTSYLNILEGVNLVIIFLINIAIFIYLIIKRPLMTVGVLAGIPVLILILFLLWLALCLFVVVAWFVLLFLRGIGLI
jgi:hypothetical protein